MALPNMWTTSVAYPPRQVVFHEDVGEDLPAMLIKLGDAIKNSGWEEEFQSDIENLHSSSITSSIQQLAESFHLDRLSATIELAYSISMYEQDSEQSQMQRGRKSRKTLSKLPSEQQITEQGDLAPFVSQDVFDDRGLAVWTTRSGRNEGSYGKLRLEVRDRADSAQGRITYSRLRYYNEFDEANAGLAITFWQDLRLGTLAFVEELDVLEQGHGILDLIYNNDFSEVMKSLDDGKVTAKHVTHTGMSLLSYAIYDGPSPLFKMLLARGADTNSCDLWTNTIDIISLIWNEWLDSIFTFSSNINIIRPDGWSHANMTINDCITMSNLALSHDCRISVNIPYNCDFPNIFFLSDSTSPARDVGRAEFCLMFTYLKGIGFNIEQVNARGQTPLLHACLLMGHDTIHKIGGFISSGAEVNIQDNFGRNPLHSAVFHRPSRNSCFPNTDANPVNHEDPDMIEFNNRPLQMNALRHMDQADAELDWEVDRCEKCWDVLKGKVVTLLEAGCDPNTKDKRGRTPSDYAWKNGFVWYAWLRGLEATGWDFDGRSQRCHVVNASMLDGRRGAERI